MESVTRMLHGISLIWITDAVEQQYIITARTIIEFQIGLK